MHLRKASIIQELPWPILLMHTSTCGMLNIGYCWVCRYTEHEFDQEFIDALRSACYKFVGHQGDATLHEIATFIRDKVMAAVLVADWTTFQCCCLYAADCNHPQLFRALPHVASCAVKPPVLCCASCQHDTCQSELDAICCRVLHAWSCQTRMCP